MLVTSQNGNSMFLVNYATQVLCFILVTPFVFLRVFVRWRLSGKLGIDDVCCFIGWLVFMGYCANGLIYGFKGGTKSPADLKPHELETCIKFYYICTVLYAPAALFVKTSLIYILIRVFQPLYRGMVTIYLLLSVVIGYYTIITFIKMFICNPISAYWTRTQETETDALCLNQPGVIIADSIISFLTDIAIFAFPVTFIWPLQMPFWKKVKVTTLLGLGGIAVAFSLYRLVVGVYEIKRPDDTTMFTRSILTANAEVGLGLICACLPAFNILTKHTQQNPAPWKGLVRGNKKKPKSTNTIFDGTQSSRFVTSHLSSSARRGSTDSAVLMASQEQSGLSAGDNTESIIKMVSLNQHWEQASQSNEGTDRTDII